MARARGEESEMNNATGQMTPPPRAASTEYFWMDDDGDVLAAQPTPLVEVEVPTIISYSSLLQRASEQIIDIPVPQGRVDGGGFGGLQGSSSSSHVRAGAADEPFQGVFRTFHRMGKGCVVGSALGVGTGCGL